MPASVGPGAGGRGRGHDAAPRLPPPGRVTLNALLRLSRPPAPLYKTGATARPERRAAGPACSAGWTRRGSLLHVTSPLSDAGGQVTRRRKLLTALRLPRPPLRGRVSRLRGPRGHDRGFGDAPTKGRGERSTPHRSTGPRAPHPTAAGRHSRPGTATALPAQGRALCAPNQGLSLPAFLPLPRDSEGLAAPPGQPAEWV